MNEPYENQLIGTFLYALGQEIGRNTASTSPTTFGVNLLQQTPLDCHYGDVVLGSERCVLIEFKRTAKQLASERAKWTVDELEKLRANTNFVAAANVAHQVIYGRLENDEVALRRCTYPDVLGINPESKLDRDDAWTVVDALARAHRGDRQIKGLSGNGMAKYLTVLRKLRNRGESKGSGDSSAWLGVAKKENGISLFAASSIERLLTRSMSYEIARSRDSDRSPGLGF